MEYNLYDIMVLNEDIFLFEEWEIWVFYMKVLIFVGFGDVFEWMKLDMSML